MIGLEKIGFIRDMLTRSISESHGDDSLSFIRQLLIAIRDEIDDQLAKGASHEG